MKAFGNNEKNPGYLVHLQVDCIGSKAVNYGLPQKGSSTRAQPEVKAPCPFTDWLERGSWDSFSWALVGHHHQSVRYGNGVSHSDKNIVAALARLEHVRPICPYFDEMVREIKDVMGIVTYAKIPEASACSVLGLQPSTADALRRGPCPIPPAFYRSSLDIAILADFLPVWRNPKIDSNHGCARPGVRTFSTVPVHGEQKKQQRDYGGSLHIPVPNEKLSGSPALWRIRFSALFTVLLTRRALLSLSPCEVMRSQWHFSVVVVEAENCQFPT